MLVTLDEVKELNRDFSRLNSKVIQKGELQHFVGHLAIPPSSFERILISHHKDPKLLKLKEQASEAKAKGFFIHKDASLRFKGRWCLPMGEPTLRERILDVAHSSKIIS